MCDSCMINPILAFLIGAIPFGYILSELFGDGKLCESGSKNIGATNVFRTQGKVLGFLTFLLDFLKGYIIYYLLGTGDCLIDLVIIAAPVLGHVFTPWLKFKGGKGVATYFGVLAAVDCLAFGAAIMTWLAMFLLFRISAVSGLTSVVMSVLYFGLHQYTQHVVFLDRLLVFMVLAILIILKHRENIKNIVMTKNGKDVAVETVIDLGMEDEKIVSDNELRKIENVVETGLDHGIKYAKTILDEIEDDVKTEISKAKKIIKCEATTQITQEIESGIKKAETLVEKEVQSVKRVTKKILNKAEKTINETAKKKAGNKANAAKSSAGRATVKKSKE